MTSNDQYATDESIDVDLPVQPAKAAQYLFYLIIGVVVFGLVWASTAKLDRVTRAEGRVVPSSQLQTVQYFEGGIVKKILVKAGDAVKQGDVLVQLDSTQVNADYSKGRDGYNLLAARIIRLETESQGASLSFPGDLAASAPQIVADERALFQARLADFRTNRSVHEAKLDDAKAAATYARQALVLADEELQIIEPLVADGIEPRIELVRVKQRRANAENELKRAEIAVRRAESELVSIEQTYRSAAASELTHAKEQMAEYAGELPALRDRIERTDLKAPIDGVVNRVMVTTIGGTVRPGETVVELVPDGDTPLVQARIKPADIGFLTEGQDVMVKLTAYDSSIYGSLPAAIETIGADAVADEKTGEQYFEIWVRTDQETFKTADGDLKIMPGMAAEVDILNGKRSVLAYLLKPLTDVRNKALRDE